MEFLGNLAALIGCVIMVCIGLVRKKEHILLAQCAQFAFMGMGNLALGAIAGVIANGVSIARNLVFARVKPSWVLKIGFLAVQVALTALTGISSVYECLPIAATVIFTLALDWSDTRFKLALMASQLLWLVYDVQYHNYVAAAFDVLTVVSTGVGIWMLRRRPQAQTACTPV